MKYTKIESRLADWLFLLWFYSSEEEYVIF